MNVIMDLNSDRFSYNLLTYAWIAIMFIYIPYHKDLPLWLHAIIVLSFLIIIFAVLLIALSHWKKREQLAPRWWYENKSYEKRLYWIGVCLLPILAILTFIKPFQILIMLKHFLVAVGLLILLVVALSAFRDKKFIRQL